MADLVSLADAKAYLGISSSGSDFALQLATSAASDAVLAALNWDPRSQSRTELHNGNGGNTVAINCGPITALGTVQINLDDNGGALGWPLVTDPVTPDPYVIAPTQLYFDGNVVVWKLGRFLRGIKNVSVTYTSGFDPLPQQIVLATMYTLKAMHNARLVDPNATSESYAGVMSQGFWGTGPGSVPPQAMTLLNNFILRIKAD